METNEIMANAEDIMDVTEEVATCGGSKTLKIAGVVAGAALVGVAAYMVEHLVAVVQPGYGTHYL